MSSKWLNESIRNLKRIRDIPMERSGMFRMDRNERTWPFREDILNEIRKRIDSETLTNYPEMDGIYHKLAGYLGVATGQIYFHSGSDLVIKSIFETYLGRGDRILMQNPSYAMYGVYARMYEGDIYIQEYDENLLFDIEKYSVKIAELKPKIVILENPNGYIGNSYSLEQVRNVINTAHENNSLVLVDEAYIDYIPESGACGLVSDFDNLIIVRTFSKAWGLAGMRAGYALSNELLISEIFKVMPMHELTSSTIVAVDTVLDHADEMKAYVKEVTSVRDYFLNELRILGIRAIQSDTHFVTVAIGDKMDPEDFRNKAHDRHFFLRRPFGQEFLQKWVRIGLLPMKEMELFVNFMKEYILENK